MSAKRVLTPQLEWHESEEEDESDESGSDEEMDEDPEAKDAPPEGEEMEEEQEEQIDMDRLDLGEEMSADAAAAFEERVRTKLVLHCSHAQEALRRRANAFMGVAKDPNRSEEDVMSTPAPGEVLQTFYLRTKSYWASLAFQKSEGGSRGKQMRRDGFDVRSKATWRKLTCRWPSGASSNTSRSSTRYVSLKTCQAHCRSSGSSARLVSTTKRSRTPNAAAQPLAQVKAATGGR